ncbi:hypothetical protein V1520DRAFT_350613 [Lipomyces starkeyi]
MYVLRLLFLEYALPSRAYSPLGIARRRRIYRLQRLEPIRERHMVMGSQPPFEELISLRNLGQSYPDRTRHLFFCAGAMLVRRFLWEMTSRSR